jgi:RNA polymerase sigma-70 factor (ECF subfamily)
MEAPPTTQKSAAHVADPNLEQLVRLAQEGGRREMDTLLRKLRPLVARWALVWTGSPDIAEDVAQRVLMKVHRSIKDFSPRGAFETWVYRITRNALIDVDRKTETDRRFRDRMKLYHLVEHVAAPDTGNGDMRKVLLCMMQKLSLRQRAVLDLVDLQGFEAGQAAEMLDLSPSTIRVHLHRAREALRTMYKDRGLCTPVSKERIHE